MSLSEFAPIFVLILICFICIATSVILTIRSKRSLLKTDDKDFIDQVVEHKKCQLNATLGRIYWKQYITFLIIIPILLGGMSYLFISPKPLCIVFAVIGLFVPELLFRITIKKRKRAFESKYAMALRTLSSSLRSGLTIEQAVDDVSNNPFVDGDIRKGFRQISSDIKVGIPLSKAFQQFAIESGSKDASDVAAAITMQSQVGGNEAKVVSSIAQNINDRLMMRKEIKTIFTDSTILIWVMDFMPWLMLGILSLASPQFIAPYFSSFGMVIILISIMAFTTVGSFVLHKLANKAKGR